MEISRRSFSTSLYAPPPTVFRIRIHSRAENLQTQQSIKLEFHDADADIDTDILARILADTSDTRDFLKLFLWQAERHVDILATIFARMSARMPVSVSASVSWNASFTEQYGIASFSAIITKIDQNILGTDRKQPGS